MNVLLQYEVLPRLTLRELLRVRSVCKSWNNIISKPWFSRLHHAHNPIPASGAILTHADSAQGTFLLNPDKAAWVRTPSLDCPTNPPGALLASSGGLLCYGITRSNEAGRVIEVDYVIWNPVTNRRTHLPTLHVPHPNSVIHPSHVIYKPCVVMVVRQGELHQLWVNFIYAFAVFDCFISEESMQTRMACNRKMTPLPNSWIALWLSPDPGLFCYVDSKIVYSSDPVSMVDVDTFTVSDFPCNDSPIQFVAWNGKIFALVPNSEHILCSVCDVIIDTEDGSAVLDPVILLGDHRDDFFQGAAGTGDYFYATCESKKQGVLVHMGKKVQQEVEHPDDKCKYALPFEPSFTDSPGSPCNVNFDWSGFQFPERTSDESRTRELELYWNVIFRENTTRRKAKHSILRRRTGRNRVI